jgi:alpha-tubulin suppressor-like RCC1 family protein
MVSGSYDTCALKVDGSVWCWGGGNATPAKNDKLADIVELASGTFHKCARKRDGTVWCWGGNSAGQLGNGSNIEKPDPVPLGAGARTVKDNSVTEPRPATRVARVPVARAQYRRCSRAREARSHPLYPYWSNSQAER